ncbi:amidohydrolase [Clostridium aciditolerans]|uniref:Amidohydrolase family protein n=1 Tax=Clostridium aciditolerans TaxID=339861 RepID=A0A934M161_9CLOT|nr:amidohydrolase [Clostridium aciditolerans]MBI6872909.1 amidohydrolase family protein [Clostridium aciditolerans]
MNNNYWLKNVLLEDGFIYEKSDIVGTKTSIYNILIKDGKVEDFVEGEINCEGINIVDGKGLLILPGFHENHIHIDKTYYGSEWQACKPFRGVAGRIEEEKTLLVDQFPTLVDRAEKVLKLLSDNGAVHVRTHCNVDQICCLKNVEGTLKALQSFNNKMTYDIVAFPQHGLLKGNTVSLIKEAMNMGGNVMGGLDPANVDGDIDKSLNTIMDIATNFDSDIDIHLHDGGSLGIFTIKRLIRLVEEAKWQGRVNISHCYCLAHVSSEEASMMAEAMAASGISISSSIPIDIPVIPIPMLHEKGVKVAAVNDSITDHWFPFGTGDMLERATRLCERFGWIDEYSLSRGISFITGGKTILDAKGNRIWPQIGDDASFVLTKASCSAEAVARRTERKAVVFKGEIIKNNIL